LVPPFKWGVKKRVNGRTAMATRTVFFCDKRAREGGKKNPGENYRGGNLRIQKGGPKEKNSKEEKGSHHE